MALCTRHFIIPKEEKNIRRIRPISPIQLKVKTRCAGSASERLGSKKKAPRLARLFILVHTAVYGG